MQYQILSKFILTLVILLTSPSLLALADCTSAVNLVQDYYQALNKGNSRSAIAKWKAPSASLPTVLATTVREKDFFRLNQVNLVNCYLEVAEIFIAVYAKKKTENVEIWEGTIRLEKVSGQWKIAKMLLKRVESLTSSPPTPLSVARTVSLTSRPVAANAWCGIVNTEKSSLDVYAGMSQDTKVVATASKGSALTCTETTQTDWYKVTLDDGQTGYAYAPGEFILGPGPGREARCGTVETEDATLNVREGMGTNTKVIDKVRKNAMIRILDNRGEEGEWLKVQIDDGKLGYVRKKFVDISETVSETVKPTSDKPKPVTETISPPTELPVVESTPKSDKPKPVTETISPPTELPTVESTPKSEKLKPVTEATLPPTKLQPAESTQELDKIDKPIVAMEVKSLSPEEIQAVQDALKTLQKLSAATEVGVNFKEYGTLVIEAKAQTNAALVKLSEGGLKEELEATMDAYADALTAWNAIIKHKFDSEYEIDSELRETLVAKYPILATIRDDEVTPVIWHFAGEHLKRTNELFNRSLRKTQSPAEQFKIIVWLLIVIVFLGLYVIWDKLLKNIKLTSFKAKPVGETSQQMIAVNQESYSSSPIEVIATTIKLQQKQEYLPSIQGVSALQKSGGIIALIAGIFGIIAALVTLLFGGLAGAFKAEGAGMVIGLGWGGILFSFLTIVFAAISMGAKSRTPGVFLILTALLGAVLGGTFVAIFMSLAFIGGILATIGVNKSV